VGIIVDDEFHEIVSEQAGVHNVTGTNMPGADIFNNGTKYHSNIHVGELHWAGFGPSQTADPTDNSTTPNPSLQVEVDRYENASTGAVGVLDDVEENYALYGINVSFTVSQNLSDSDLQTSIPFTDLQPPTSYIEMQKLEKTDRFRNDTSKAYVFITTQGEPNSVSTRPLVGDWSTDTDGVASTNGLDVGYGFGIVVFTQDHNDGPRPIYYQKTIAHEVGHLMRIGRNDDGDIVEGLEEVYSGDDDDETKEYIGIGSPQWSVMVAGWQDGILSPPMSGQYVPFTIEELLTTEFNEVDTIEHD